MSVVINSFDQIAKKLHIEEDGIVMRELTNTCYRKMDKYVPFDEGTLASNVLILQNSITYATPYASYQYYGERADGTHKIMNRTKDMHPQATSFWDEAMKSAEMDDIINEIKPYIGGK